MSAALELTAIAPELMDAVICMEGSPAYAAFKEEIEAILRDFNENGTLSSSWTVNETELTENSEDTLKNMHRAFLVWSHAEEAKNGADAECSCSTYVKLFFKSQKDTLISLNGGREFVEASAADNLIERFKAGILADSTLFDSVKDFFKGYVYGYFFNYLTETTIMKKYAEMFAYLGVMSGKVQTGISEQQKILPKMAMLLSNDRFKYLSGYVPRDLMLPIVMERIDFASMPENEADRMKEKIIAFIDENYKHEKGDNVPLISDDVSATVLSRLFASYTEVPEFCSQLYSKCYNGTRTFLDADKDDTGEYSSQKLDELVSAKCERDSDSFYSSARDALLDASIEGDMRCYKYPLITKDDHCYYFAAICEELIYPMLDEEIYLPAPDAIPADVFPFAAEAIKTNCIRMAGGLSGAGMCIRKDKQGNADEIQRLAADGSLSSRDRKMLMLEQALYIMSGSCSEAKYKALITENLFGTKLYDEYIRYRMDVLFNKGIRGLDDKKWLLDRINEIEV
ncbi:MAG: hypothetical protein LIO69_07510 [Oscillospiraceae bacterium]|nr:hypothetical protein [Oscillospiraceae bacterium]